MLTDNEIRLQGGLRNAVHGKKGEEFFRSLANYVVDEMLNWFNPVEVPVDKPQILRGYELMGDEQKKKWDTNNPDWQRTSGVLAWKDRHTGAINNNNSHIFFLKDCIKWLGDDMGRINTVKSKLREFDGVNKEDMKEVQTVLDTFGGSVCRTN